MVKPGRKQEPPLLSHAFGQELSHSPLLQDPLLALQSTSNPLNSLPGRYSEKQTLLAGGKGMLAQLLGAQWEARDQEGLPAMSRPGGRASHGLGFLEEGQEMPAEDPLQTLPALSGLSNISHQAPT